MRPRRPTLSEDQRLRYNVAKRLLEPAVFADRRLLGRELSLLKRLMTARPFPDFWLNYLKPALKLDTFLYFCGGNGAEQLRHEWDLYMMLQSEEHRVRGRKPLDSQGTDQMLESSAVPTPTKKRSRIDWADSPDC